MKSNITGGNVTYYDWTKYNHWVPPYGWPYGWPAPYAPCVCPCCGRLRDDRIYMPWQQYWIWSPNDNPTITVNMTPEVSDVAA